MKLWLLSADLWRLSSYCQCNDNTLDLIIDKAYYIYPRLKVTSFVQTTIWSGLKKRRRTAAETAAETLIHVQRDELPFFLWVSISAV